MEAIWTVRMIQERYNLKSATTAIRYIRQINGHMEKPLGVYESDLAEWEESRRVYPQKRQRITRTKTGTMYVPRHR